MSEPQQVFLILATTNNPVQALKKLHYISRGEYNIEKYFMAKNTPTPWTHTLSECPAAGNFLHIV